MIEFTLANEMTKTNKNQLSSNEELVKIIDMSPKGPVFYQCKDILLGQGGYGKVFKGYAVTAKTRIPVAIKTGCSGEVQEYYQDKKLGVIPREVYILKHLPRHLCAIQFLHYQETSSRQYIIIMDRPCRSKNLYRLRGESFFPFTEQKAKKIVKNLGSLLLKMEGLGIIHGDIKPRNIIYDLDRGTCKLVDFGLARYHGVGELFHQFEGTQSFMPPEFLISGYYDPRDETVWRLGIITYYLLTGCRPYKDTQEAVVRPQTEPTHLKHFSTEARDIVKRMLSTNPNERPRLKEVLKHPWISGSCSRLLQLFSQYKSRFRIGKCK